MKDCLASGLKSRGQSNVVAGRIGVPQIVRVVAAGNLDANSMAAHEDVASRSPEIDRVFVWPIGFERAEFVRGKHTTSLWISVAGPHDTLAQKQRATVGMDVGQPNHPVGVTATGAGEQFGANGANDFDIFSQLGCVVNQHVTPFGGLTDVARAVDVSVRKCC